MKKILHITLIDIIEDDSITTANAGFLSLLFINEDANTITCASIVDKEINNIALITYSKFLAACKQKRCNTLDEFIAQELSKHNASKEYIFMRLCNTIGNDLMFQAFKTSDTSKVDDCVKKIGITFEDISNAFKKDYNLEFTRAIVGKLNNGNLESGTIKILTSEVFEEMLERLKHWFTIGVIEAETDELMKVVKEYFFEGFEHRFGTEIDVDNEAEEIIRFYSDYFGENSSAKMKFFKSYTYGKKYRMLKDKSFDLAVESLNSKAANADVADEAKKILIGVEKLNKQLEKEAEEVQQVHMEDAKEILINCMSAPTGDRRVLGREIGELAELFNLIKRESN